MRPAGTNLEIPSLGTAESSEYYLSCTWNGAIMYVSSLLALRREPKKQTMPKAAPVFKPYPEVLVPLSFAIPEKAMASLQQIAKHRQKSCDGLILEYLSFGMRNDLADVFRETAMRIVDEVVSKRLPDAEAKAILQEIRDELRPAHMREEFRPKRPSAAPAPVVDDA